MLIVLIVVVLMWLQVWKNFRDKFSTSLLSLLVGLVAAAMLGIVGAIFTIGSWEEVSTEYLTELDEEVYLQCGESGACLYQTEDGVYHYNNDSRTILYENSARVVKYTNKWPAYVYLFVFPIPHYKYEIFIPIDSARYQLETEVGVK